MNNRSLLLAGVLLAVGALAACTGSNPAPTTGSNGDPNNDSPETAELRVLEGEITARVENGQLLIAVPVQSKLPKTLTASGQLDLVQLDDERAGQTTATTLIEAGQTGTLTFTMAAEHLDIARAGSMDFVLDWSVGAGDGPRARGKRSLFHALPHDQLYLVSSDRLFGGTTAAVRIIARDSETGEGLAQRPATVKLSNGEVEVDAQAMTGADGSLSVELDVPDIEGEWTLSAVVQSPAGPAAMEAPVQVRREARILLVTDKPFYQPSQTIHLRALAMRRPNLVPEAGQPVVFEVQDAKGNKLFRETGETDRFGVAYTQMHLASELNMGTWRILASVGDTTVERAVTVERYALPKFRVGFASDRNYYAPGDSVHGTIRSDYFFGKAVSGGAVTVTAWKFDLEFTSFAEITGTLDDDGVWDFDLDLPDFFVGQPLEQGNAFVRLDIQVVDGAGHPQTLSRNLAISVRDLLITAVPASDLVPGTNADVFVLVSDPTGRPAAVTGVVRGDFDDVMFDTDARGIAKVTVPTRGTMLDLEIEAAPELGDAVTVEVTLGAQIESDHALSITVDRAIYAAGETALLDVRATPAIGRAFVDVLHAGQVVASLSTDVTSGTARIEFPLAGDIAGSLQFEAYAVAPDGNIPRAHALAHVESASELTVAVTPAEEVYRPGETARLDIQVDDAGGEGVVAAVGLMVVDEAVFALQDFQPGLEKVYFQLEQELLTPRYEIHGHGAAEVLSPPEDLDDEDRNTLAALVFAAAQGIRAHGVFVDTWNADRSAASGIARVAQKRDADAIWARISAQVDGNPDEELIARLGQEEDQRTADPWGKMYGVMWDSYQMVITGCGPDEQLGTDDDFRASYQPEWWWPDAENDGAGGNNGNAGNNGGNNGANNGPPNEGGDDGPRVRSYFPETLYVNPAIITDESGAASIDMPLADSITTWRTTALASSLDGGLGSSLGGVRVFQEFFVDVNFPATLTAADEVTVPVALYNYLEESQTVQLRVDDTGDDWYELLDSGDRTIELAPGEVRAERFTVRVTTPGWHDFQVTAIGEQLSDAVRRRVLVVPDGQEQFIDYSDRLSGDVAHTVAFPAESIDGAHGLWVKIYPGFFSQAVEGLDSLLRMPSGCFEQTSMTTYPNVLVLQYLRETEQTNPEVELKALEYINLGYQRLLSFESSGGGFEWFGGDPGHRILTAYGLLEFTDMSKVSYVDPDVLARTQQWLLGQREGDGRWKAAPEGIHEGATNNFTDSDVRATAYITYAMLESGTNPADLAPSLTWLRGNLTGLDDSYSIALAANALLAGDPNDATGRQLAAQLDELKQTDETGGAFWQTDSGSFTYGTGDAMAIETTVWALEALLRAGGYTATLDAGTTWLIQQKDSFGSWSTTQATILTLRFLLRTLGGGQQEADATITVSHDGQEVAQITVTTETSDLLRMVDLAEYVHAGSNDVTVEFEGTGTFMYQVTGRYYVPWDEVPAQPGQLDLSVSYDRTTLETDEIATATVTVTNTTDARLDMILVDLGIPPGFDVLTDDFQQYIDAGQMQRVDTTGRQILVYLYGLDPAQTLEFSYRLRAGEPLRAQSPPSVAYLYYEPNERAESMPEAFQVE
jgi:alpha-2-macroglobulin-like protein